MAGGESITTVRRCWYEQTPTGRWIPSRILLFKMMMQRKTLSGKQATGSRSVAAVRATPVSNVKAVATALVNAFAPAVAAPARRVVATRAAVEAPTTAPSFSVQEKTTNPLNLVFVATEVKGASEWSPKSLLYPRHRTFTLPLLVPVQVAPWSKTGGLGDVVGGECASVFAPHRSCP